MKLRALYLLPGVMVLAVLLLVVRSDQAALAGRERFERELGQLDNLDANLDADVLKVRCQLLPNYDSLGERLGALRQSAANLSAWSASMPSATERPFREKMEKLAQLIAGKEQLIERFKSENAVLTNSLRYLPIASANLFKNLAADDAGVALEAPVNRLMQQVFAHTLLPSDEQSAAISDSLAQLAKWRSEHPNHPAAMAVATVAAHVASIVKRKPKAEALTLQIISVPTGVTIAELQNLHALQLAGAARRSDILRWALEVICSLLAFGIGFTILALHVANRDLERRVAERTVALRESNERFEIVTAATTNIIWDWDLQKNTMWRNENFQKVVGCPAAAVGTDVASWIDRIHPEDAAAVLASLRAVTGGEGRLWSSEYRLRRHDGSYIFIFDRAHVVRNEMGRPTRMIGARQDITARWQAEQALRESERHLQQLRKDHELILNSVGEGIQWIGLDGLILFENRTAARLLGWDDASLVGRHSHSTMHHTRADGTAYPVGECPVFASLQSGVECHVDDEVFWRKDGSSFPVEYKATPVRDEHGAIMGVVVVFADISKRKAAEVDLRKAHRDLLETSRQAGMAEVATAVLHNVGNVLNSVNVACACVVDGVRKSKGATLTRIVAMLRENEADLGAFFTGDARARQLPAFLGQLCDHLTEERATALRELGHLQKNIEHINDIVAMQQSYAKISGLKETVQIAELMEDTLRMNAESMVNHRIRVERDFAEVPSVTVEKHKVLQILVNLVRNAKHACDDGGRPEKTLTLRIFNGNATVKVAVSDNGIGIPAENLQRIFNHGFTTKKTGHGFGLHNGALAARELGGTLHVESKGIGHGATFTLELPVK